MQVLCGLVGIFAVVFVIAAVVHLIWTLCRAVFSGGTTGTPDACPNCAQPNRPNALACTACGFDLGIRKRPSLSEELKATDRQLRRLAQSGRVSETALREVLAGIEADISARDLAEPRPAAAQFVPGPIAAVEAGATAAELTPLISQPAPVIEFAEAVEPPEPLGIPVAAQIPVTAESAEEPETSEVRGLAGVLQSFMEEKNIRWGELVSGLLIVVSSVGLVISLWATLKEAIPYFPVAVFLAATAAMHGAGLYTLRRWRLRTTSRGLLLVSTLLVPLNVLAAIALNDRKPVYGPLDYFAVMLGLCVLAAIVFSASRVLNKHKPWPMFVAVTGTAAGMSMIGRLASPARLEWQTFLLFALPFASFGSAALAHVQYLSAGRRLSARRAARSFRFLGISLFSLVLAAGLLAWKSRTVLETLSLLSPLVSLVGAVLTAAGLVVERRMTAARDAGYRTAGTSIALGGGLVVMAALVLAWPRPDLLVAVGLLNATAFSGLAWMAAMPALDLFAVTSLSLACLVGFEWASGRISIATATSQRLSELLLEVQSAFVLTLLSLLSDAAALVLGRTKARSHAIGFFASAILQAGVAVGIAAFAVFQEVPQQNLATAVFLLLAIRWLWSAWWIRREYATWTGAALLLAAFVHCLTSNTSVAAALEASGLRPADPWTLAFLLHAGACVAYAGAVRLGRTMRGRTDGEAREAALKRAVIAPLCLAAVLVSGLAIPSMLNASGSRFFAHSGYAFGIVAIWFLVGLLQERPVLAGAAQAIGTVGVAYGVIGYCRNQPWWNGSFFEPRHLNAQMKHFGRLERSLDRGPPCLSPRADGLSVLANWAAGRGSFRPGNRRAGAGGDVLSGGRTGPHRSGISGERRPPQRDAARSLDRGPFRHRCNFDGFPRGVPEPVATGDGRVWTRARSCSPLCSPSGLANGFFVARISVSLRAALGCGGLGCGGAGGVGPVGGPLGAADGWYFGGSCRDLGGAPFLDRLPLGQRIGHGLRTMLGFRDRRDLRCRFVGVARPRCADRPTVRLDRARLDNARFGGVERRGNRPQHAHLHDRLLGVGDRHTPHGEIGRRGACHGRTACRNGFRPAGPGGRRRNSPRNCGGLFRDLRNRRAPGRVGDGGHLPGRMRARRHRLLPDRSATDAPGLRGECPVPRADGSGGGFCRRLLAGNRAIWHPAKAGGGGGRESAENGYLDPVLARRHFRISFDGRRGVRSLVFARPPVGKRAGVRFPTGLGPARSGGRRMVPARARWLAPRGFGARRHLLCGGRSAGGRLCRGLERACQLALVPHGNRRVVRADRHCGLCFALRAFPHARRWDAVRDAACRRLRYEGPGKRSATSLVVGRPGALAFAVHVHLRRPRGKPAARLSRSCLQSSGPCLSDWRPGFCRDEHPSIRTCSTSSPSA